MLSSCLPRLTSVSELHSSQDHLSTVHPVWEGSAFGQHSVLPVPDCGMGFGPPSTWNSRRSRGKQEEQQRNLVPTLQGPALSRI